MAERVIRARIACSTVMVLPGDSHSRDGGIEAACRDTTSRWFSRSVPRSSASKVSISVIILVSDAG